MEIEFDVILIRKGQLFKFNDGITFHFCSSLLLVLSLEDQTEAMVGM